MSGKNGGRRPGAGRKKGEANRRKQETARAAVEAGITPLEFMLRVMRTEAPEDADPLAKQIHRDRQFEAAKAAAPYIHPRLTSVSADVKGSVHATVTIMSEFP